MKIKTIIIDDERKAIAILKNKIERFCPNIEIIGETQDPVQGVALIKNLKPQLVFIDIAMPELNGFELLKQIEQPDFEIIFATAFDDYAIEAIRHCAIGYLVKPIDNQDLTEAVNKALINIEAKTALQKNRLLIENLGIQKTQKKKIAIPSVGGIEFVRINDIIHCKGEDGYTKIYFRDNKTLLSSNSIGHFNKLLKNQEFYLVHKSHLINMEYIEKYLNEGYVLLAENHKIPISRNRRTEFLNQLKN